MSDHEGAQCPFCGYVTLEVLARTRAGEPLYGHPECAWAFAQRSASGVTRGLSCTPTRLAPVVRRPLADRLVRALPAVCHVRVDATRLTITAGHTEVIRRLAAALGSPALRTRVRGAQLSCDEAAELAEWTLRVDGLTESVVASLEAALSDAAHTAPAPHLDAAPTIAEVTVTLWIRGREYDAGPPWSAAVTRLSDGTIVDWGEVDDAGWVTTTVSPREAQEITAVCRAHGVLLRVGAAPPPSRSHVLRLKRSDWHRHRSGFLDARCLPLHGQWLADGAWREVEVEDLDLVGSLQRYAVEHGIALSVTEAA